MLNKGRSVHCPNVSITPITAMGFRQCLPLTVVQLKDKHCRKPHCRNGAVDTFGLGVVCVYCVLFVSVYCLQKGPSIYFTFDLKGNSALVTQDSFIAS
jgi:hypothetical protein